MEKKNKDALEKLATFNEAVKEHLQLEPEKEEYACETGPDGEGCCTQPPLSRYPTSCREARDRHCCPADPDARADDRRKAEQEEDAIREAEKRTGLTLAIDPDEEGREFDQPDEAYDIAHYGSDG